MTIAEIFETMDYGAAPEGNKEALAWLDANNRSFGHFINGAFTKATADFKSSNPANGDFLADLSEGSADDVNTAVKAARKAQSAWAKTSGHKRAKVLYAIARLVQKHSRILAVLETMDNGKPIRESRDIDIPLVAASLLLPRGYGATGRNRNAGSRSPGRLWPSHPLELPASDARLEGRACACHGQYRGS